MEDKYNDIDKLFTDSIESYEMEPSNKVWESLDNKLDKKAANKYRAIAFRLRLMLAGLIFLFGSFSIYFFLFTNSKSNQLATNNPETVGLEILNKSINNPLSNNSTNYSNESKNENEKSINNESKLNDDAKLKGLTNMTLGNKNLFQTTQNNTNNKKTPNDNNQIAIEDLINTVHNNSNSINKNNDAINERKLNDSSKNDVVDISKTKIIESNLSIDTVTPNETNTVIANIDTSHIATSVVVKNDSVLANPSYTSSEIIPQNKRLNRISIVGYFSPDFTKKHFIDANKNDTATAIEYDGKEIPDFSFNTGFLVGYDMTSKWTIKIGVTYAYLMQSIKPKTVYAKQGNDGQQHYQFNTSYGNAQITNDANPLPKYGDSLKIKSTSTQLLQLISVPIIATYNFHQNKLSYYAQLGLTANFLVGEKLLVETPNGSETITSLEGLREYYLGGILGVGVSYNPIKKLTLILEPTLRGAITTINKNTPIKSYPYSLGVSLGLGWHF